ncbi:MAG: proprotein convertase P-domain-containing protein, partial [Thermoanaerobaculia bacterium]
AIPPPKTPRRGKGNSYPAPPNSTTLSHFDGLNAGGEWVLNLQDQATGTTGILEEWCLIGTACDGSVTNRIFGLPPTSETIQDCGTLAVGPHVWVHETSDLTLRAATGVAFNNGVSILGDLTVEIDPSLAPP